MKFNLQQIIRPSALNDGDLIGIVAPSGPFDRKLFDAGLELIHSMGFDTCFDESIYERQGFLAGDDARRVARFNAMVADDEVKAVMCARGGYGALRILDRLDYEVIAGRPKPLIGFSDITALHQVFQLKTGLVSFHGPMVTTLARATEETRQWWYSTLTGTQGLSPLFGDLKTLKPGFAEGVLTGGNLATLCHMVGTPYGADYDGTILMIEDVGEAPYRIDRMLTQMRMAGVLDGVAGIVVGSFEDCGPADQVDALIVERFGDMDIPIVSGAPFGHGRVNMTVPLGVTARLDADRQELSLLEPVFQH